jgi:hypothetical protein
VAKSFALNTILNCVCRIVNFITTAATTATSTTAVTIVITGAITISFILFIINVVWSHSALFLPPHHHDIIIVVVIIIIIIIIIIINNNNNNNNFTRVSCCLGHDAHFFCLQMNVHTNSRRSHRLLLRNQDVADVRYFPRFQSLRSASRNSRIQY